MSDSLVNEDVSPEDSDLLSKSGSDPLKWKGSTSPGQVSQRLKMSDIHPVIGSKILMETISGLCE